MLGVRASARYCDRAGKRYSYVFVFQNRAGMAGNANVKHLSVLECTNVPCEFIGSGVS